MPIDKKFSKSWLTIIDPKTLSNNKMQQIKEELVEEESDYEPIVVSRKKKTTNSKY